MTQEDIERLICLLEQKYLSKRLEISEGRNIILLALLFEMFEEKIENPKQLIFKAFTIQYLNPSTVEIENAKKYIESFKDKF